MKNLWPAYFFNNFSPIFSTIYLICLKWGEWFNKICENVSYRKFWHTYKRATFTITISDSWYSILNREPSLRFPNYSYSGLSLLYPYSYALNSYFNLLTGVVGSCLTFLSSSSLPLRCHFESAKLIICSKCLKKWLWLFS